MRALTLLVFVGCSTPAQREVALPTRSLEEYRLVQPIVAAHCGTLDCHGDAGRPLVLHGPMGLRLGARGRFCAPTDGAPCRAPACVTDDELAADVLSFAALDAGLPLAKVLDDVGGGMEHVGGAVWPSSSAPGYVCLRSWLEGSIDADACEAACAADCDCQVARACGEPGLPQCLVDLGIDMEDDSCP